MELVIVPNVLQDAINEALDKAIVEVPDAAQDREVLYQRLLEYYDEHGVIPEFTLTKINGSEDLK